MLLNGYQWGNNGTIKVSGKTLYKSFLKIEMNIDEKSINSKNLRYILILITQKNLSLKIYM